MQQSKQRSPLILFLAATVFLGLLTYIIAKRQQQVAGICELTGERLSDEKVLQQAKLYAESLAVAYGGSDFPSSEARTRIVPDSELRLEEQAPAWVKATGGYRAYVEIAIDEDTMSSHGIKGLRPLNLIIVSNCGAVRIAMYEYTGGWLW
jgi:hypothetical protein